MQTMIVLRTFHGRGRTYTPGQTITVPEGLARVYAADGLAEIQPNRMGARDKMVYGPGLRRGEMTHES